MRYEVSPPADGKLGTASLDGAMIVMSYHDLYFADPRHGWPIIDASRFIDQIVIALKPGAALLIADHAARRRAPRRGSPRALGARRSLVARAGRRRGAVSGAGSPVDRGSILDLDPLTALPRSGAARSSRRAAAAVYREIRASLAPPGLRIGALAEAAVMEYLQDIQGRLASR